MKRILYVFALLFVSSLATNAQQRAISIGNTGKSDVYTLKPGKELPVEAAPLIPFADDTKYALPANILADTTIYLGFTTRIHPFPDPSIGEDIDTTRILRSRTSSHPDSIGFIGDMRTIQLPQFNINGFAQFVPFKYFIPEIANGTFRLDSIRYFMYPLGGNPLTTNIEAWLVSIPQNYSGAGYQGYNFDFYNGAGVQYISEGPLDIITADSVNAHLTNNSIRRITMDFSGKQANLRTVDASSMWGIILVKENGTDTSRLAMIAAHEWTVPANQTFGGFAGRNAAGVDSVVAAWKTNLRWGLSTVSYPSYAQQGWKINYNMEIFGEWIGEIIQSVEPVSKEAGFTLEQNQPNPVNGDASIQFSVNTFSNVTLRVYNTLGQQVAELANGNYDAGTWKAGFNTANLPVGSYVYVLNANGQSISRTLQVVR